MLDSRNSGNNGLRDHERWTQMCALLTADTLTADELEELNAHIETCADCRKAAADFQDISRFGPPLLLDHNPRQIGDSIEWPEGRLKKRLFASLDQEEQATSIHQVLTPIRRLHLFGYVFLALAIGIAGYFLGAHHRQSPVSEAVRTETPAVKTLALQLADLTKQRDQLLEKETEEAERINHLSAQLADQSKSFARLKDELEETQGATGEQQSRISTLQGESAALKSAREEDGRLLQQSRTSIAELREELSRLQQEHTTDLMRSTSMQKTIDELSVRLRSSDAVLSEQQTFLNSDRDIRELMGARDLLIADVSDIDKDGNSRGPFGRLFYTKNKSLIFYAFDLDKHPTLRNAQAFQAWGQKSADVAHPLNLGIFYMDNEANRRWVLKFDNPKLMEHVDAVFVTLEPKGGSETPHGKQLMYAFLHTPPNHP